MPNLVQDLQPELDDARFKRAGNAATAARRATKSTAQATGGQVEVGVIEGVIHLGAELHLEPFERRIEILVQRKIRGVVRGRSARVAAFVAEWAQQSSSGALGSRQRQRRVVYVLDIPAGQLDSLGKRNAVDAVRTILVRSAIRSRDLRRERVRGVRRVRKVKRCTSLHGVDPTELPSTHDRVHQAVALTKKLPSTSKGQIVDQARDIRDGQIVIGLRIVRSDV